MKSIKGQYGYIKKQRNRVIIWTVILFVIAFSLFIAGYVMTKTKKNLLTIVAVLGLLPASKSLVNAIMFWRAKGCSEAFYHKVKEFDDKLVCLYDMYFTTYKTNYPVSHLVLKNNMLCGYTEVKAMDVNACKKHLEDMLTQSGYKNMTVKIFESQEQYLERLRQLAELPEEQDKLLQEKIDMLLSVSL